MKLPSHTKQHIKRFRQLIIGKLNSDSENNSKLLSDKFSSELSSIPELDMHIDNSDSKEKKTILGELGTFMQIREFNKGHFLRKIYESNNDFIMLLKGKIMEFEIKYVNKIMTFPEYILFVIKLFLLKENFIYYDCIEKNKDTFPFNLFKYFIDNSTASLEIPEEEKNNNDLNWIKEINIIEICNELNIKNFDFSEEYEKLKNFLQNSSWNNYDPANQKFTSEEYNDMVEAFFDIYNSYLNIENYNKNSNEEVKYKVCLPYFVKKGIIGPISFIGDLNRPIQLKNYSAFVCLNDCFTIYINKYKISPTRPLFKYIYNDKKNYIAENLFSKHYLFEQISVDYLNKFSKYMKIIKLQKDEILFEQDEPHKGVYIVLEGSLQFETCQSYKELIYLNFLLMHSLDYIPNFISNKKNEEINSDFSKNRKNNKIFYLNGYYDYNSNLNNLMKNQIFQENSLIKENIIFSAYKKNDIIGLGETYDYKYKINIFTTKALNDDTELIFIPNEIFQALLSTESIYNKCGSVTEEKTKIMKGCIDKYKKIFEKKIEMLINKKQIKLVKNKLKKFESIFNNNYYIGSSTRKMLDKFNNKSQTSENSKSSISKNDKNLNDINIIKDYNSHNINLIMNKPKKSISLNNIKNYSHSNSKLILNQKLYKRSLINKRNHILNSMIFSNEINENNTTKKLNKYFSNYHSEKKDKRFSRPMLFSYDFNSENRKNNNYIFKNSQKIKIRSLSAQKTDEPIMKKNFVDYQIKKLERNRYYNNMSGNTLVNKNKNISIFPQSNNLIKSNIEKDLNKINILNKKKIIINKFSSSGLFRKSSINNNKS